MGPGHREKKGRPRRRGLVGAGTLTEDCTVGKGPTASTLAKGTALNTVQGQEPSSRSPLGSQDMPAPYPRGMFQAERRKCEKVGRGWGPGVLGVWWEVQCSQT